MPNRKVRDLGTLSMRGKTSVASGVTWRNPVAGTACGWLIKVSAVELPV